MNKDICNYILKNDSFNIIVKPNSPETIIKNFDESKKAFRMEVHAKPENNKANFEIIKFFKKEYKINVKIIKGLTSKEKTLKLV
jgi:uncharacterized protein (TIGR00251 family)